MFSNTGKFQFFRLTFELNSIGLIKLNKILSIFSGQTDAVANTTSDVLNETRSEGDNVEINSQTGVETDLNGTRNGTTSKSQPRRTMYRQNMVGGIVSNTRGFFFRPTLELNSIGLMKLNKILSIFSEQTDAVTNTMSDVLNETHSGSDNVEINSRNRTETDSNEIPIRTGTQSKSKPRRTMYRQNMGPYGRFTTQRSAALKDHKQELIQSQIKVQNLLSNEIKLRCEKTAMQLDVMRLQKSVEEKKVLLEEKKADLELLKIEFELNALRSNTSNDNN